VSLAGVLGEAASVALAAVAAATLVGMSADAVLTRPVVAGAVLAGAVPVVGVAVEFVAAGRVSSGGVPGGGAVPGLPVFVARPASTVDSAFTTRLLPVLRSGPSAGSPRCGKRFLKFGKRLPIRLKATPPRSLTSRPKVLTVTGK
jgi:hypothetical protein